MSVPREMPRWLLSVTLFLFVSILAVFTAYYFSGKRGQEDQKKSRKASALLTTMWAEIDAQWPMNTPIPKVKLDDWIISKTGHETAANLTSFEAKKDSDPLILYHGPEIHPYVQILFRDGGITTWHQTWRSIFIETKSSEVEKHIQTEP
jgi:hypothetical protein